MATGTGIERGYLDSTSTHRPALVTLTDLAPTILDTLEVEVARRMIGQAAPVPGRRVDVARGPHPRRPHRRSLTVDRTMNLLFIGAQSVLYGLTALAVASGRRLRSGTTRWLVLAALTCGAWPFATYLLRIWTPLYSMGTWTIVLSWAIAGAVAAAAMRFHRHPLDPLLVVSGLTVALLVGDLATGAHLQVGSFFGYMPHTAPRFTGLGNSGFALLAGSSVMLVTGIVGRAEDREPAWWIAAATAVVVVLADAAPWMGTDVGGILALVPVLGVTLWALRGRRIRLRTVLIAAVLGAVVLGLAVGFEALRDPGDRTHIGRFFLDSDDGGVGSTFRRKWTTNVGDLARSPLYWIVPFLAAAGIVLGRRSPAMRRLIPPGSTARLAVVACLAVGTLGWLVNDSGVVVLALACVPLGPLFLLLVDREAREGADGRGGGGGDGPPPAPPDGARSSPPDDADAALPLPNPEDPRTPTPVTIASTTDAVTPIDHRSAIARAWWRSCRRRIGPTGSPTRCAPSERSTGSTRSWSSTTAPPTTPPRSRRAPVPKSSVSPRTGARARPSWPVPTTPPTPTSTC